jgi:predicted glycogen debranching enzyme
MPDPLRRIEWPVLDPANPDALVSREWLVTNALGGYASGTVAGVMTRRYHGLLIAALAVPLGRTVMLTHIAEQLRLPDGRQFEIVGRERTNDAPDARGTGYLTEFRLEIGLPVWRYEISGTVIEKRVFMPHLQNSVQLLYTLIAGSPRVELVLRPSVNFRPQEAPVSEPLGWPYELRAVGEDIELAQKGSPLPPVRFKVPAQGSTFTVEGCRIENVLYRVEENRGYRARGDLWSPGYFRIPVEAGQTVAFIASTESFETMTALETERALQAERNRRRRLIAQAAPEAQDGVPAELVLAADQFIVTPAGRVEEAARARAAGDEVRTIIAGYHWFTDWGRDTMIGLEGLALATGRRLEAGYILRTFAHYVRDGLIPNLFPERQKEGLYHTADATLWFFHAISRYVGYSNDQLTLSTLYPILKEIVDCHVQGTLFGIKVDPADGLLRQGAEGYQLTWMDAKVEDRVVTPRRGKAVEINALWYNALRLMEKWADERGDRAAREYRERAQETARSFNDRFWCAERGHLYDVVDTEAGVPDAKCRPNQILAIALPCEVLQRDRWEPVLRTITRRLLTPFGLRTLAPDDPDFKPRYYGDLRARDAAYHQGTVWAWLIGPFVDAWLKVYPGDDAGARHVVEGFVRHLDDGCVGTIGEIFDADAPYTPRGCIAQAWSVAELLRAWIKVVRHAQHPWVSASVASPSHEAV